MSKLTTAVETHGFSVNLAIELKSVELAIMIQFFVNVISKHKRMKRNSYDGRTWNHCTRNELTNIFPYWSEREIKYHLELLVKKGILLKNEYNDSKWDKTKWYAFADENRWGISNNSYDGQNCPIDGQNCPIDETNLSDAHNITLSNSVTTSVFTLGNDSASADSGKTMPFASSRKKKEGSGRKYPLKMDQLDLFDMLKKCNLECDDDCLIILIRTFSRQKILDAISHLEHETNKGTVFKKSRIAFFRSTLNGKQIPITDISKNNVSIASKGKEFYNWTSLIINDKYVKCEKTHKEISTNLPQEVFIRELEAMYKVSKKY